MPLTVTPPPAGLQAGRPLTVKPVDLQPALDRLHNAFKEGQISASDIQKRMEVGNTEAEAQRKENEARSAAAEQKRIQQEGGKGYARPGRFSRLLGIGGGSAAAPAPVPTTSDVTLAPAVDVAPAAPVIPSPALTPAAPAAPGAGNTPFLAAAQAPDFNPAHESTDDLLNLVGEAGYQLLG